MKLLTVREVCALLRISRTSLYDWLAAGRFPKPIHLQPNVPRWREDDVRAWIDSREAA